jgi:hypothetical protein
MADAKYGELTWQMVTGHSSGASHWGEQGISPWLFRPIHNGHATVLVAKVPTRAITISVCAADFIPFIQATQPGFSSIRSKVRSLHESDLFPQSTHFIIRLDHRPWASRPANSRLCLGQSGHQVGGQQPAKQASSNGDASGDRWRIRSVNLVVSIGCSEKNLL